MQTKYGVVLCFALLAVAAAALQEEDGPFDSLEESGAGAAGALRLPQVISSNMVLQQAPVSAVLWGWSTAGATVTVTVNNADPKTAVVAADGTWKVNLTPRNYGGPYTIQISDGSSAISLTNVLFGDVYLCSGQSNMQMTVSDAYDAANQIEDSINYPNMRVFTVALNASYTPLNDVASAAPYQWGVSSPAVIGGPDWDYFSASCYFFGKNLYTALGGEVPLGLLASDYGGTYVQAWTSPNGLSKCNGSLSSSVEVEGINPNQPSVLWNAMIVPFLNMRFHGVLWYQGEANEGEPEVYACRFPAMITDWRLQFGTEFAFIFVQLAPWLPSEGASGLFPALRVAQAAALNLDLTGMAVATDLGDPESPLGSIHPRDKETVGLRASLVAQSIIYQQPDVTYAGPTVDGYSLANVTADEWQYTLNFGGANWLTMNGTEKCETCCFEGSPFEIYDTGIKQWVIAQQTAIVDQTTVLVSSTLAGPASGLRYAWWDFPQCMLYNEAGLPAPTFTF